MTAIQIFENPEFGKVTTAVINGKEHFAATECTRVLGYSNPQEAIRTHCKGVRDFLTPTKGGEQRVNFISEGDLFRLIVNSRLPQAERFERWVFDEVLPSIRKKGYVGKSVAGIVMQKFRIASPKKTQSPYGTIALFHR